MGLISGAGCPRDSSNAWVKLKAQASTSTPTSTAQFLGTSNKGRTGRAGRSAQEPSRSPAGGQSRPQSRRPRIDPEKPPKKAPIFNTPKTPKNKHSWWLPRHHAFPYENHQNIPPFFIETQSQYDLQRWSHFRPIKCDIVRPLIILCLSSKPPCRG